MENASVLVHVVGILRCSFAQFAGTPSDIAVVRTNLTNLVSKKPPRCAEKKNYQYHLSYPPSCAFFIFRLCPGFLYLSFSPLFHMRFKDLCADNALPQSFSACIGQI